MKTRRLVFFAMILTLLAVLMSSMSVSAAAEGADAPSVSIERFNLSFEDSIYIKYAVKLSGADAEELGEENFRVLFWTEPQTSYVAGTEVASATTMGTQTISGVRYHIFAYEDLAAKQMTDDIYARAYLNVDGTVYYSDVEKYSVLQYAYNKLGYTGTASTDAELKDLLNGMLSYGAAAQKYFDYKLDRLATYRFYQVTVSGGTLSDGCDSGLYLTGDPVTLTAPATNAAGLPFKHWQTSSGEVLGEGSRTWDVMVGAKNETYTAVYEAPHYYLTFTELADGTYSVSADFDYAYAIPSDLEIPATYNGKAVTVIGKMADNLVKLTIPASVKRIEADAFADCRMLEGISVAADNTAYKSVDGDLYTKDGKTFVRYAYARFDYETTFMIPESVTAVADYAFVGCDFAYLEIRNTLESIGAYAFKDSSCYMLTYCGTAAQWQAIGKATGWDDGFVYSLYYHQYDGGAVTAKPTHTEYGVTTYTCMLCGDSYTEPIEKLTAHEWDNGTVTTDPTHLTEGVKTYRCPCGDSYTEPVDKLTAHEYGGWASVSDTQHARTCPCGDVAYADHRWNSGEVTVEPTFSTTGVMVYSCLDCGKQRSVELPILAELSLSVSGVDRCGSEFWILVNVEENPGVYSLSFELTVDSTAFEFVKDEKLVSVFAKLESSYDATTGVYTFTGYAANEGESVEATGVAVLICLRVKDDAPVGAYSVTVDPVASKTVTANGISVPTVVMGGVVNVIEHTYDGGTVTYAPTETFHGLRVFTCVKCGHTYEELIPPLKENNDPTMDDDF